MPGKERPGEKGDDVKNKKTRRKRTEPERRKDSTVQRKGSVGSVQNALSVTQAVTPKHTASDVKETFNDVSSLVDRVRAIPLNGGETYQRGYVKATATAQEAQQKAQTIAQQNRHSVM